MYIHYIHYVCQCLLHKSIMQWWELGCCNVTVGTTEVVKRTKKLKTVKIEVSGEYIDLRYVPSLWCTRWHIHMFTVDLLIYNYLICMRVTIFWCQLICTHVHNYPYWHGRLFPVRLPDVCMYLVKPTDGCIYSRALLYTLSICQSMGSFLTRPCSPPVYNFSWSLA